MTHGFKPVAHPKANPGASPGDTVEIKGIQCQIVSPEDAEKSDFVVCAPETVPLYFPDNLTGECADCGDPIQWRPHAPRTPPKICMRCMEIRVHSRRGGGA